MNKSRNFAADFLQDLQPSGAANPIIYRMAENNGVSQTVPLLSVLEIERSLSSVG